jgi:hypothetical protein
MTTTLFVFDVGTVVGLLVLEAVRRWRQFGPGRAGACKATDPGRAEATTRHRSLGCLHRCGRAGSTTYRTSKERSMTTRHVAPARTGSATELIRDGWHRSPTVRRINRRAAIVLPGAAIALAALMAALSGCASTDASTASTVAPAPSVSATIPPTPPMATSGDQTLVTQLNAIKGKYPQDTTPRVTLSSLPAFLSAACSIVSSGFGSSPEWKDIATLLAQMKRCP